MVHLLLNKNTVAAALRWVELLEHNDLADAKRILFTHGSGNCTATQYASALDWLVATAIVVDGKLRERLTVERLLELALVSARPTWLSAGADGLQDPPQPLAEMGETLPLNQKQLTAAARAALGRLDHEALAQLGLDGELALLAVAKSIPGSVVDHVSQRSDGYGYDISCEFETAKFLLETKASRRGSHLSFYLSRNEFEVARIEQMWRLIAVSLRPDSTIRSVSMVSRLWLLANEPGRSDTEVAWQSAKFRPPDNAVRVTTCVNATALAELLRSSDSGEDVVPF